MAASPQLVWAQPSAPDGGSPAEPATACTCCVVTAPPAPASTQEQEGVGTATSDTKAIPESKPDPIRLFIADGQLRTHAIELFTTANIPNERNPRVLLLSAHAVTTKQEGEDEWRAPQAPAAVEQERSIEVAGSKQTMRGTVLLFDFSEYPVQPAKPMTRVRAILVWDAVQGTKCEPETSYKGCSIAIADREVNVGNPLPAYLWAGGIPVLLFALVWWMRPRGLIGFLQGDDGHLSLSRCQFAAWTLAIGWVVTAFGFMLQALPELPWQVAALMGLSLTTTAVRYSQAPAAATAAATPPEATTCKLADLIIENGRLSLTRVQMTLWTLISITLFVSKSVLQGTVWAVPIELLALMGISQSGYLIPKWIEQANAAAAQTKADAEAAAAAKQAALSKDLSG